MPGVPSGKACDGCRKQKKKCDEQQPTCGRCLRLDLACVGSGLRRYKFEIRTGGPGSSLKKQKFSPLSSSSATLVSDQPGMLARPACNQQTLFAARLVQIVKFDKDIDLRYNITWTFGGLLTEIPRRLGANPALDAAVAGLVKSHEHLVRCPGQLSYKGVAQYGHALRMLRESLEDPVLAISAGTLAAVMILMILQHYLGINSNCWTGHAEGAAKIIKVKGMKYDLEDPFESSIMLVLRGPVLVEGLLNPNIQFTRQEWRELITNPLSAASASRQRNITERMLICLARVPEITTIAKQCVRDTSYHLIPSLLQRAGQVYKDAMECLAGLRTAYLMYAGKFADVNVAKYTTLSAWTNKATRVDFVHFADSQRLYNLALFTTGYINKLMRSFGLVNNSRSLEAEAAGTVSEIIALAEASRPFRPLGASGVPLSLVVAWINIRPQDHATKKLIEDLHLEFSSDFPGAKRESVWDFVQTADWIWDTNRVCGERQELPIPLTGFDYVG